MVGGDPAMLNPTTLMIDALSAHLVAIFSRAYGGCEPEHRRLINGATRLALERIGNSDALYHDVEHTVMVTQVGTEILRGKALVEEVSTADWLHMTVALLFHDIGYVRGVCSGDTATSFVINEAGDRVEPPRGASDAVLTPYHVDRGKIFMRERAANLEILDADRIARAIELTRFPVPDDADHRDTRGEPGLVRAADLVGQMADPAYLRKHTNLFHEFAEVGTARKLGFQSPADLADGYPAFFWGVVEPFIGDALSYLQVTQEGRQWIANLYANIFAVEHDRWRLGPYRGRAPLRVAG
jgi:hypothetical protein